MLPSTMCGSVFFGPYRASARVARLVAGLIGAGLIVAAPLHADDRSGLSIGVRAESGNYRSFHQFEPTTGEVRTYRARVYGGIGLSLGYEQWFAQGWLSWSLCVDYWRSLFFTSGARRLSRTVETTAQRTSAIAALSLHEAAAPQGASVALLVGAGDMSFDYALPSPRTKDDAAMELATGDYTYATAGIGGRIPLAALTLFVRSSYVAALHTGSFGSRTAQNQPHGFDALATLDYRLLPWLELSLRAGYTLLVFRLAPLPARSTDAPARVQDEYLVFGLGAKAYL
jgi:hypothetical protein